MRRARDERLVFLGERAAHRHLLEPVGERAGFALVLQLAHAVVIRRVHGAPHSLLCRGSIRRAASGSIESAITVAACPAPGDTRNITRRPASAGCAPPCSARTTASSRRRACIVGVAAAGASHRHRADAGIAGAGRGRDVDGGRRIRLGAARRPTPRRPISSVEQQELATEPAAELRELAAHLHEARARARARAHRSPSS